MKAVAIVILVAVSFMGCGSSEPTKVLACSADWRDGSTSRVTLSYDPESGRKLDDAGDATYNQQDSKSLLKDGTLIVAVKQELSDPGWHTMAFVSMTTGELTLAAVNIKDFNQYQTVAVGHCKFAGL